MRAKLPEFMRQFGIMMKDHALNPHKDVFKTVGGTKPEVRAPPAAVASCLVAAQPRNASRWRHTVAWPSGACRDAHETAQTAQAIRVRFARVRVREQAALLSGCALGRSTVAPYPEKKQG